MKKLLPFIFLLISSICLSQTDNNKALHEVYNLIYTKQFNKAKQLIEKKFINDKDDTQKILGYVYLFQYYIRQNDYNNSLNALIKAQEIANQTNNSLDQAYVDYGFFSYYTRLGKKELAYQHYIKSDKELKNHPKENFIRTFLYLDLYGFGINRSIENKNYEYALQAYKYAKKSKNLIQLSSTANNLGFEFIERYYFNEEQKESLDSMNYYFTKGIEYSLKIPDDIARNKNLATAYLNYAAANIDMMNIEKSLEYNKMALEIVKKDALLNENYPFIYTNFGYAYYRNNDLNNSLKYFKVAYNYYLNLRKDFPDMDKKIGIAIIDNLCVVYADMKDYTNTLIFQKKRSEILTKNFNEEKANNIKSLEFYYNTEKKNQEIKNLNQRNEIYTRDRIFYVITSVLALLFLVLIVFVFRNKLNIKKQRVELLEAQNNEAELTIQLEKEEKARIKAEQEILAMQQEQLEKTALETNIQLDKKNTILQELKNSKIKDPKLSRMLKDDEFTDDDFNEIEKLIADIHPTFYKELEKQAVKKLTNLDNKYAAYIYLNMNNHQIADVLKMDVKTVRVAKYRLKQKLGLDKEVDLVEYVQQLNLN